MSEEWRIAESYRSRAEDLRTIAEQESRAHTRARLLAVADDDDKMATSMDAQDEANSADRIGDRA